jgi:hypothetical protein
MSTHEQKMDKQENNSIQDQVNTLAHALSLDAIKQLRELALNIGMKQSAIDKVSKQDLCTVLSLYHDTGLDLTSIKGVDIQEYETDSLTVKHDNVEKAQQVRKKFQAICEQIFTLKDNMDTLDEQVETLLLFQSLPIQESDSVNTTSLHDTKQKYKQ